MYTPILHTKLHIPLVKTKYISRPHLVGRLNAGLSGKLTLISAPAGFGKTTLLSEWIAACGRPVAWLSLDSSDNDLARFLAYIDAALQTICPDFDPKLPEASPPGLAQSIEPAISTLIDHLGNLTQDFILALDDYQQIKEMSIHEAINLIIEHQPTQMHLVIATRSDPPIHFARLRGHGQLTELRQRDLRFSTQEVTDFLTTVMGLRLSTAQASLIEERTEGWVAGLQMAALSLQGSDDIDEAIDSFGGSSHYIMDYLLEEVLLRLPDDLQTFLLHTSILDRLSGPLCDALIQTKELCLVHAGAQGFPSTALIAPPNYRSSEQILDELEHANLFLVPLDMRREWFRYHHLFSELLRLRLEKTQPELAPELHRRACEWYEQNGYPEEAAQHAPAAGVQEFAPSPAEETTDYSTRHDNSQPFPPDLQATFRETAPAPIQRRLTPRLVEPLSERELEVLRWMADGATNLEIAWKLSIAPTTVKKHVSNIFAKLSVATRTQAVARGRALNLLG
jgi:LuxR family maltose regulon positive regulatory protein